MCTDKALFVVFLSILCIYLFVPSFFFPSFGYFKAFFFFNMNSSLFSHTLFLVSAQISMPSKLLSFSFFLFFFFFFCCLFFFFFPQNFISSHCKALFLFRHVFIPSVTSFLQLFCIFTMSICSTKIELNRRRNRRRKKFKKHKTFTPFSISCNSIVIRGSLASR